MKKGQLRFLILTVAILAASIVTARALRQHYNNTIGKPKAAAADTADKAPVYDQATLSAFQGICRRYESTGQSYTISGHITVNDPADTSAALKDVSFLCCKNGGEMYYRLGKTETINAGGLYVYIDHQARTILVSGQKELQSNLRQNIVPDLGQQLASEEYELISKTSGTQRVYSLINEHHISCKEYSVTVDSSSQKLRRILTRLSSSQDPLEKAGDKVIDVEFDRWDDVAVMKSYTSPASVVHKNGNGWLPAKGYQDYQLIKM